MKDNLDLLEVNELSKNAWGGTELMLRRLYDGRIPRETIQEFQVIPTRVRELNQEKYRILIINDLPGDPEVNHLADGGWSKFHRIVFVSNWQMQAFIERYQIPWSRCIVMLNAILPIEELPEITRDDIRLIYHTTPHRGLNILLPVFEKLRETHKNIHLDIYSSFALYGWKQRDEEFAELFKFADDHPHITNHGAVPNANIRQALVHADIFAYPSIWPETSCLCLMEAMSAGLNCVHPNYGALYETGAGWTTMYHWNEDLNEHAKMFCSILDHSIKNIKNEAQLGRQQSQKVYADAFFNWDNRSKQWNALMQSIIQSKEPRDVREPEKEFNYQVA